MSARNTWIISAVILIIGFIVARTFVMGAMEKPKRQRKAPVTVVPDRVRPAPSLSTPNGREVQQALSKVAGAVPAKNGQPAMSPELAHQVLLSLSSFDWTPEDWAVVGERLDKLNNTLAKTEDPALQALDTHILATRIEVMEKAGTPDDALRGALETLEASHPERFAWRTLKPGPNAAPTVGVDPE